MRLSGKVRTNRKRSTLQEQDKATQGGANVNPKPVRPETQNAGKQKKKLRWFCPLCPPCVAWAWLPLSACAAKRSWSGFDQNCPSKKSLCQSCPRRNHCRQLLAQRTRAARRYRGELLRRLNVEDAAASAYLRVPVEAESFRKLAVGKEVQAETNAAGGLIALRYLVIIARKL